MPSSQMEATPDLATVERLSTAFNGCSETLDAGEDVFAPDAFFDFYPPFWRFQLQGADVFAAQLRGISEGEPSSRLLRVVPTATGFVMEHEETKDGPRLEVARRLWLCEGAPAASPRSLATATAAGTTSCGPARRPKPRCCGPEWREERP